MSTLLPAVGPADVVAALLGVALNAYVLTGGADLGGGLWVLLAHGPRRDRQRALVAGAIGPIWEANHVWLIIVVVIAFTAFPPFFAALTTALHVPLAIMLIGIVLRGSAFIFQLYGEPGAAQARWERTFAIASTVTPVLLGTVIGTIAVGAVPLVGGTAGATAFLPTFVTPWLAPFPLLVGVLALALVAQLAATYLTLAATDAALRDDFRRRALWSAAVAAALAAGAGVWFHLLGPTDPGGLLRGARAPVWLVVTAAVAATAVGALWRRRYALARLAGCAEVSLILWGWAVAQYPFLLPPTITIDNAAAPRATLTLLLAALIGGAVVLIPSLAYLWRTFEARRDTGSRPSPGRIA